MSSSLLLLLGASSPAGASGSIARIQLTYRGVSLQEPAFGMWLQIIRGLDESPSVRGIDPVVPWRQGRFVGNRVRDVLDIELEGIVTGDATGSAVTELSTWRRKADYVGELFDPIYPGTLEATLEDGTVQRVVARTLTHTWDQLNPMLARVNVALESVDPDWTIA